MNTSNSYTFTINSVTCKFIVETHKLPNGNNKMIFYIMFDTFPNELRRKYTIFNGCSMKIRLFIIDEWTNSSEEIMNFIDKNNSKIDESHNDYIQMQKPGSEEKNNLISTQMFYESIKFCEHIIKNISDLRNEDNYDEHNETVTVPHISFEGKNMAKSPTNGKLFLLKEEYMQPLRTKSYESFKDDGFFITGDLAKKDENGYFTIVGRDKDMIISGGLNVYPKEIEDVINELPNITESAVFGVQHDDFGEAVVAAVVTTDDKNDGSQILDYTKDKIAKYKQPKKIIFMSNLPRNSMGKVQKNKLRENNKSLFKS